MKERGWGTDTWEGKRTRQGSGRKEQTRQSIGLLAAASFLDRPIKGTAAQMDMERIIHAGGIDHAAKQSGIRKKNKRGKAKSGGTL